MKMINKKLKSSFDLKNRGELLSLSRKKNNKNAIFIHKIEI